MPLRSSLVHVPPLSLSHLLKSSEHNKTPLGPPTTNKTGWKRARSTALKTLPELQLLVSRRAGWAKIRRRRTKRFTDVSWFAHNQEIMSEPSILRVLMRANLVSARLLVFCRLNCFVPFACVCMHATIFRFAFMCVYCVTVPACVWLWTPWSVIEIISLTGALK